jgi:hypothetical protein
MVMAREGVLEADIQETAQVLAAMSIPTKSR